MRVVRVGCPVNLGVPSSRSTSMNNVVDNDDKPVSEYATIMHEELAPYNINNYDLGKKSQSKMM